MIRFTPPQPSTEQLRAKAASGSKGCVVARQALKARVHDQLLREIEARSAELAR